jgi:hypothetical protein
MVLVAPQATRQKAQAEVLALLRQGSGSRPRFDPALAGGFRAWLEDAASLVVRSRGEDAPALHLGPRQLLGESGAVVGSGNRDSGSSTAFMTACLVHALFRQIVMTGSVDDPLGDATGALRVDPSLRDVVRQIEALTVDERRTLTAVLKEHVQQLRILTPRLAPGWLPRTDDPIAVPLAGGRVVVHGRFDLLIGTPSTGSSPDGTASLCAVGLAAEGPWAPARRKLHLLALLETIRSGTPPFRVALLHSGTGRYGVEDVLEEHLRAVVSLVAVRLAEVARAAE